MENVQIVRNNGVKILPAPRPEHQTPYFDEVVETSRYAQAGIFNEINRHFRKRGDQFLSPERWNAVIVEEYGEAIQAMNKKNWNAAITELVETITCCIRLINEIEARERFGGPRPGVTYHEQD